MGKKITFRELPKNVKDIENSAMASLEQPEYAAALFIAALARYKDSREDSFAMIDFLKGPASMSTYEKQFVDDRMSNKKDYLANSFFEGATPENNYTPTSYAITFIDSEYPYEEEDYIRLYVRSGGADSPRPIILREKKSTGQWFLHDQMIMSDIRIPANEDPWA